MVVYGCLLICVVFGLLFGALNGCCRLLFGFAAFTFWLQLFICCWVCVGVRLVWGGGFVWGLAVYGGFDLLD